MSVLLLHNGFSGFSPYQSYAAPGLVLLTAQSLLLADQDRRDSHDFPKRQQRQSSEIPVG